MKIQKTFMRTAMCAILISNIYPANAGAETKVVHNNLKNMKEMSAPKFSENGKARALDLYWHRMAQCETGGDWKDKGTWSGGLGIYTRTWIGYGGREFAPKPELATIDEQIIIANRISTQGYQTKNEYLTLKDKLAKKPFFRPAVGFGGWGCKKHVGNPVLFKKFPANVLFRKYRLGERGPHVSQIQKIIGTKVDGYFGPITDNYYNKFFAKYGHVIRAEYKKYHPNSDRFD